MQLQPDSDASDLLTTTWSYKIRSGPDEEGNYILFVDTDSYEAVHQSKLEAGAKPLKGGGAEEPAEDDDGFGFGDEISDTASEPGGSNMSEADEPEEPLGFGDTESVTDAPAPAPVAATAPVECTEAAETTADEVALDAQLAPTVATVAAERAGSAGTVGGGTGNNAAEAVALDAEEKAIKAERAANKEEAYKENLAQAAAKKAARVAEEAAQKAEEEARQAVLAEEQKLADELKAAEVEGEVLDEDTALGDIRESDRVPVAQTDVQKAAWDDQNTKLLDEKLPELMSQIKTDECNHEYWLSPDSSKFDNDSLAARRKKCIPTVKWLASALTYSFLHKDIENAAVELLQSRLAPELQNLQQFLPLKEMLKERAEELGELLATVHYEQHLKLKLSDKRVSRAFKFHPLVEGFDKVTNLLIVPQLKGGAYCNPRLLDYDRRERMDEMAALQVVLLSAHACDDGFQSTMKELATPFADVHNGGFTAAPPKSFMRPYNKGVSECDYRYDELPRAASQCKDGMRNMIVVRSVADLIGLVKAMSEKFGGLGGLKNPFALSDEQKADRNHLLLMNITVIYEDELTYSEMFGKEPTKDMVAEYTRKIQMLPRDRWNGSITKAIQLMTNDTVMKNEKVKVLAEVQVLFEYDKVIRGAMHDLYVGVSGFFC